jgi:hypothetical protein
LAGGFNTADMGSSKVFLDSLSAAIMQFCVMF